MPFLLLKLLGIGKWLREAATALFGWIGRYPWQAAVIALCALSAWLWHGNNVRDRKIAALEVKNKAQADMFNRASAANLAAQQAQVKALEAKYTEQAKEAQQAYDKAIATARPAVVRYIDGHRLHKNGLCRREANSPGEGTNPGIPPEVPSDPGMVAIRSDDLQALAEWATVGIAEHNRAVTKLEDGTAEVVKAGVPEPAFGQ